MRTVNWRNRLLLKPEEAAAVLGIGRTTVYSMIRRGKLPVVRFNRTVRVHTARLVEMLDQVCEPAAAPMLATIAAAMARRNQPGLFDKEGL